MTEILIEQFTTAVPASVAELVPVGRFDTIARRFSPLLAGQVGTLTIPTGRWYVRRLDVRLPLGEDDTDLDLGRRWAELISAALIDTFGRPGGAEADDDLVCFRSEADGLVDLLTRLARGDSGRAWAWRAAGLLGADDPDPDTAPGPAARAALRRATESWSSVPGPADRPAGPAVTVAALVAAVTRSGLIPVLRLLGEGGLAQLADALLPGGPAPAAAAEPVRSGARGPSSPGTAPEERRTPTPEVASPRAAAVLDASTLAVAWRRSGLRPTVAWLEPLAVLIIAEAHPAALTRPAAAAELAREICRRLTGPPEPPDDRGIRRPRPATQPGTGRKAGDSSSTPAWPETAPRRADQPSAIVRPPVADPAPRHAPGVAVSEGDAEARPTLAPAEVSDPPADARHPTGWGGLIFLLNTADEAGIPTVLAGDGPLAARESRWVLHRLAQLLVPLTADDPAALALAGLVPDARPPAGPAPTVSETAALAELAERWRRITLARLADANDGPWTLHRLAARAGEVFADPGWIDMQLSLSGVDVAVRTAGLDLDPGFLPWLGVVVAVSYV